MVLSAKRRRVTKSAEDRRKDIMDAAGIAKGTFYLYFDSKEHVVAALREQFVAELTSHSMQFIEAVGQVDWWELAEAVAKDMVDWTLAHRDICAVIMQTYTPE